VALGWNFSCIFVCSSGEKKKNLKACSPVPARAPVVSPDPVSRFVLNAES
jgi:hypothetical protein